jgi:NDP-4-keto-2,6-dideoxyhexose 3-C-methyltransferase
MKTRKTCRVCDGSLKQILSLGEQYVSDFPEPGKSDGIKAPLELVLCERCHLLQLRHTVPADAMYQNYWYRSGTNRTMCEALAEIANKSEELIHARSGDAVLDIGCNDGTLLKAYKTRNLFKIGFDPAKNLAKYSLTIADKLVVDFFSRDNYLAEADLKHIQPKIVTSIAMFYDLEEPGKFVESVKAVMHPEGIWIIQLSYLPLMLKTNEVGNICHEHLEYYSLQSLEYLLHLHDLEVVDMEVNDINGGSIRVYIRNIHANQDAFGDATYRKLASERVEAFRQHESEMGLDTPQRYIEFAERVERIKNDVVSFIREQEQRSKKVYVYGASTKGNTLLQYFGLDNTLITAAAERNPDKWGKVTVGTHIPIVSEEVARAANPDFFLVLPWHFLEEFMVREKEYLRAGGRFIVPMPYFTLI